MTSYDLIWQLVELILKDKETKSKADEQRKTSNSQARVYRNCTLVFLCKKELSVAIHLVQLHNDIV